MIYSLIYRSSLRSAGSIGLRQPAFFIVDEFGICTDPRSLKAIGKKSKAIAKTGPFKLLCGVGNFGKFGLRIDNKQFNTHNEE